MQAQTTFAVLARDEHKQWQVRALKQKLLVDTVNYEIQVCPRRHSCRKCCHNVVVEQHVLWSFVSAAW